MKILWFTWKDLKNPLAGGAEVVNEEIAKRLARDGHEVILIVGGYPGCDPEEIRDGYKVIRVGNRWSVYLAAFQYYRKNLKGWPELIIEEINTIPFFSQWYTRGLRRVLIMHQLCREIWFYQMFFPLSVIGYLLEPLYLWLLKNNQVVTISESSKRDLVRFGFKSENIGIIPLGIEIDPIVGSARINKYSVPTLLSLGAIREMKRPLDQIKAFEIAKRQIPELKMKIAGAGQGKYYNKVMKYLENSKHRDDIEYLGRVSKAKKIELMQKSHVISVASVKEGWGLIVTEANSQGTPAVVYDVDGLRDSVVHGKTGLVAQKNSPEGLAQTIVEILSDKKSYAEFCKIGLQKSKEVDFEIMYKTFSKLAGITHE